MNESATRIQRLLEAASAAEVALPAIGEWPAGGAEAVRASRFLTDTFTRHPRLLADMLVSGELERPGGDAPALRARVAAALAGAADRAELGARLRGVRRREMARIAWRDLGGEATLEETLADLSDFADAAIAQSLTRLDAMLRARRGTPRDAAGEEQSLVVFGLGKLGARELNFSSDVDLIFAYPRDGETHGARRTVSNHEYFLELGRALIEVLQRRTEEGFVFRVDMRLRPFGSAGPLALSFGALEDYYQHHGRDWERYALVRMRPIAGDIAAGERLCRQLEPFVYRRYIDFGALESLRDMKAMIAEEVTRRELGGHVKLGPGGIRELEFTVQAFQLVRGGRTPSLRDRRVTRVLEQLGERGLLPAYTVDQLKAAYRFLRRVENHLQAFADQQTHVLPAGDEERARLARSMGFDGWPDFEGALATHRAHVRAQFEQVLGGDVSDHLPDAGGSLLLDSQEDETLEALLAEYGFGEAAGDAVAALLRLRESADCRAMGETGERRLKRLLPDLLRAVAASEAPLETLQRVFQVVGKVLRRSTYLALLHERPITVSHLVHLCGASPWIAQQLAEQPQLLDELLDARTLYAPPGHEELEADLDERLAAVDAGDLEEALRALRQFRHRQVLRVAAADIAQALPLMKVSDHLSDIAEVVLNRVLALAGRDVAARHGVPRDPLGAEAAFCIVAYGKLGGLEFGYGSDLDLVFLHGAATGATDGPRPVDAQVFFVRLAQRVAHYLTTTTPDGILYPVDTRLRPHGNDGMLACSLESFERYLEEKAWTWEHQALVRARPVAGDAALRAAFVAVRERTLRRHRDPNTLRAQVRDMRQRMRNELGSRGRGHFDIKQDAGGIADIEFLVQYAALRFGERLGPHLAWTDNIRLLEGLAACGLLPAEDAALLDRAYQAYRARNHRLSLQDRPGEVAQDEFADLRAEVCSVWERVMEAEEDA